MPPTEHSVVSVSCLSKTYKSGAESVHVLRDLELEVNAGEALAIFGVSGTGKSTLLNVLGGLDSADTGKVVVDGLDLLAADANSLARFRAQSIAFIFQFYNLVPTLTISENVLAGLQAARRTGLEDDKRVTQALVAVGLVDKQNAFPSELSGGQQQRVAIARALVKNAPVILADEPTGNLDRGTARDVISLLVNSARQRSAALIVVTHDSSIVKTVDRVYRLDDGRLIRV